MAKEFKRSNANSSKRKKTVSGKKEKDSKSEDAAFFRKKKDLNKETEQKERRAGENKFSDSKKSNFKESKEKSSFARYRDHARPSDFGSGAAKRVTKDKEERSFKEKPYAQEGWEKKKKDKPGDRNHSFSGKTVRSKKKEINPYDLDERDLEYTEERPFKKKSPAYERKPYVKKGISSKKKREANPQREKDDGLVRLNKYISNAGICSRREADELIATGVVQVNGKTITEMGYRVKPSDIIKYGGQTLKKERMVYLVLNKPKDYITTVDDPQKRRTVLELVQNACKERIYPVGRLDRSTTGLLMFTNDGELTKKLTHPRYGVRKIYHVELDKPLKRQDMDQIEEGLELEDGLIKVDEISYVGDGKDKAQIGVELHSGKNRIVRRIFEHLGYNVRKLDRVMFGSLTKRDLPRGRWRFLTDSEVGILNMISSD